MTLLERMNSSIETMTMGERFLGSLQVTLLGVAVVFLALASLFIIIMLLDKFVHQAESGAEKRKAKKASAATATKEATDKSAGEVSVEDTKEEDMDQLVAVITAAVAASLHTSTHNIVVRNIVRTPDTAPAWNRLGRMQQINQRVR